MDKNSGILSKWREGLKKTRSSFFAGLFSPERINDSFFEELEEALILADVGMDTSEKLLTRLRAAVRSERLATREEARTVLRALIAEILAPDSAFLADAGPCAVLIIGVNGVGKTTTVGKLAWQYRQEGRKPMLAAADTFRAAAAEQLGTWAERAGVPMVRHQEGADPAAVVFDAAASFRAKGCDLLLCDTAGRLHNKQNLMNELSKIQRVISRELADLPMEVLLVLDATTGQNAVMQAQAFSEVTALSGIILTKLDGTAKGGVVIRIADQLHIPVRFAGVGEGIDDLARFDAERFAEAIL